MRYQKIHSQIWHDEKFLKLSQDARYLFLYILTSPHSNALGVYVLSKLYMCSDLRWTMKQLGKPFGELLRNSLIYYDEAINLIAIPNHLKHNTLENPNQIKAAEKTLRSLPKSQIYQHVKQLPKQLQEQLPKRYAKPEEEEEEEEEETETEEDVTVPVIVTKESAATTLASSGKTKVLDSEWLEGLKQNPAYQGIDIEKLYHKMIAWCELKGKKPTRARLLNWLNREEVPMKAASQPPMSKNEQVIARVLKRLEDQENDKRGSDEDCIEIDSVIS